MGNEWPRWSSITHSMGATRPWPAVHWHQKISNRSSNCAVSNGRVYMCENYVYMSILSSDYGSIYQLSPLLMKCELIISQSWRSNISALQFTMKPTCVGHNNPYRYLSASFKWLNSPSTYVRISQLSSLYLEKIQQSSFTFTHCNVTERVTNWEDLWLADGIWPCLQNYTAKLTFQQTTDELSMTSCKS